MKEIKNLMKALKVSRTELKGSEKQINFDDLLNEADKKEAKRITGICIRSGYIMDAIGVMYEDGKKCLHGNSRGGSETVISLENDAIHTVMGDMGISYKGSAISNLTVKMKSGKIYGPFGTGKSGKTFCLTLPEKTEFAGFFGNADENIVKSLGLIACEGGEKIVKDIMPGLGF